MSVRKKGIVALLMMCGGILWIALLLFLPIMIPSLEGLHMEAWIGYPLLIIGVIAGLGGLVLWQIANVEWQNMSREDRLAFLAQYGWGREREAARDESSRRAARACE